MLSAFGCLMMGLCSISNVFVVMLCAVVVRIILLLYGEWQDGNYELKYTDVDYRVFTDAAHHMSVGKSPYKRETYRYTPILAAILIPNVTWFEQFGKIVFCCFDLATAFMMFRYLKDIYHLHPETSSKLICLWLFNPLTLTISTRGSAESIMAFLSTLLLYLIAINHVFLAGVVYALSIVFKIYPVIYALPLFLYFQRTHNSNKVKRFLVPTGEILKFGLPAIFVLSGLVIVTYQLYGYEAIYETYLYHLFRKDTKHNFSIFFYMYYLNSSGTSDEDSGYLHLILNFFPLILQLSSIIVISFKFYTHLPFVFFLTTFSFVILNKVCTSQYFIWYLTYLPLIAPTIDVSLISAACLAIVWIAGQCLWLYPAYLLEFRGVNSFEFIWVASIAFFLINNFILRYIVKSYSRKVTEVHTRELIDSKTDKKKRK